MKIKYEIVIRWSDEDKCYVSEIPELHGCIADGNSPEEALNMLLEVYNIWMETAKKYNSPVPLPAIKNLNSLHRNSSDYAVRKRKFNTTARDKKS